MLFALFVPNIASAQTKSYNFNNQGGDTELLWSNNSESGCTFFTKIGTTEDPTRFAMAQDPGNRIDLVTKPGLYNGRPQGSNFLVANLYAGEEVTFNISTSQTYGTDATLVSDNATKNGNTFTMKKGGSLIVTIPRGAYLTSINIVHNLIEAYGYDPAIETYNLNNEYSGIQSNNMTDAGFPLDFNDLNAQFLTNLSSGLALNNRIAISQVLYNDDTLTPWVFDGGLKSQWAWHNISICNLVEGDRVRITYTGSAKFSSKAENMEYNGCAAFKDTGNNGDFILVDGDVEITCGMTVEQNCFYTITEDGHLDIALSADSKLTKIEIFSDHQANMVDKENEHETNTSYFDTTGQLEAKHHIVPGGLNVYVGNDDLSQHAEVVSSDKGPVSFVYDQNHYKMARQSNNSMNVSDALPVTGTFYKFVPEVSGKMWVKFKAYSVRYDNYFGDGKDDGNERTTNHSCPYYLMVQDGNTFQQVENPHYYSNGADGYFGADNGNPSAGPNKGITVERGKTYYLYGWWNQQQDLFSENTSAGVAELIEVTFKPDQIVTPLAKWVESGTTEDNELARVRGYRNVTVKKKSSNIASCEPYIEGDKLKIRNITFVDENKGGGTILIKIGDPNIDADPVFAYTIAYNAGYNPSEVGQDINGTSITRSEGHTWNFSDQPLKGLKWNNKNTEADEAIFGPYFNNFATAEKDDNGVPTNGVNSNCFLYEEMNKRNPDGTIHSDWTFNYRVKKNGQFHDPRFLNNYDMEGDNADMMWDTEGLIINAGSTQSCIFDEFMLTNNREIDHTNKTQADPDRYIGFLEGGSFIIPKLKKDDRVIIYMGSGEGSGAESMEFHITNARDAVYNEIDPEDFYHAGGSMWNVPDGHNDPYYRGCYHFFALDDGDMTFEMARGTMCKLYSIKIYRGARECTNGVQENGGGYTILAEKNQSGTVTTSETKSWNIHFRGKGERVADGSGKFSQENEVLTHSGNITNLNLVRLSSGQGIEYTNVGEIGMLRVRVKCMEFNYNYVTDFADRNFTLALHETQSYPYTWDFTDVNGFSSEDIEGEYDNYNEITDLESETTWYEPLGRELSMWDEDGNMILRASTEEYQNQNMIFENSKGINGNQLYANGDVIPETKGLWFYFDNNDPAYNGSIQVTEDGLRLSNTKRDLGNSTTTMGWWNTKMVVPNVPSGAAVYARVIRDASVGVADYSQKTGEDPVYFLSNKYQFGHMSAKADIADGTNCRFYKVEDKTAYEANNNEDEYIIAILNTDETSNLTFTLNGWIVKKLSVSLDPKAVNIKGWTTESRNRVIDPELTAFLTGYDFETCLVTGFDKEKRTVTLSRVYDPTAESNDALVMRSFTENGLNGANIIHNIANEEVSILSNGFHLFVPDMHDYIANRTDGITNQKDITDGDSWRNLLVSQVTAGTIPNKETRTWKYSESDAGESLECTNYSMSYRYYVVDQAGNIIDNTVQEGDEAFYRIVNTGAQSTANKGYLPLPTRDMTNKQGLYANMYTLVYEGEETPDAIQDVTNFVNTTGNNVFYTIDGQKLNGVPTTSGIYIVNGKKVVIK